MKLPVIFNQGLGLPSVDYSIIHDDNQLYIQNRDRFELKCQSSNTFEMRGINSSLFLAKGSPANAHRLFH